ncbi:MAG: hypothetical protein U5J99_10030 [Parvularculaceae bacterium]|nr:hypothetical protein [Parvularculaceae bacterium]
MLMASRIAIVALVAILSAFPARAAVTVFPSSVFSQTNVTNAASALFAVNGSAATIGAGGELVLQYALPLTGAGISATFLPQSTSPAFNIIAVSIGEVIGGVATYSGEFVLGDGVGVQNADLSALCSSVSSTGCSLLRLRNVFNFNSSGALLDGVSGVSNAPEPKAWALMLLGFAAIGWKLKDARAHQSRHGAQFA